MASKLYKSRLIVVHSKRDPKNGRWKAVVELHRKFSLPEEFEAGDGAEKFALDWAIKWIDRRPS